MFQVQLFTAVPNSEGVDHIHPNMDSYEVYVSGDIAFRANNQVFKDMTFGRVLRIRPECWHGATFGPRGGVFLSVQQWSNVERPSCAGADWEFRDAKETRKAYES
jgi:hypothetical protein